LTLIQHKFRCGTYGGCSACKKRLAAGRTIMQRITKADMNECKRESTKSPSVPHHCSEKPILTMLNLRFTIVTPNTDNSKLPYSPDLSLYFRFPILTNNFNITNITDTVF
jgi:hypothetical protein